MFSPLVICMHLLRVIQKARSALNLKSSSFFQQFFSSSFVAQIGNWLCYYDAKKTVEHNVEDCSGINSVEVELLGFECHPDVLLQQPNTTNR